MENCLFCNIVDGIIKAEVVYEDDHALAFLDVMPRAPGHTLVIPKRHAEDILELPEGDVAPLFGAVKKVSALLMERLKPDGFTIGINHGKASGQEVDHLHIHILPRWVDDGGSAIQSVVNHKSEESLSAIAKKIRKKNN